MGREETDHMRLPLEDVTVIDLSHALAGPFCSTMLADFGARVIKLEPKGAGDIARAWGTPLLGGETAYFVSLHRNKQGIEVDLKHPRGKELFFEHTAEVLRELLGMSESGGRGRLAGPGRDRRLYAPLSS
jgi:crotonobetainyl-CoA:carnitine CoA-transferase CaiB-like acyl-CoA transferase